jgi:hypothetical protein
MGIFVSAFYLQEWARSKEMKLHRLPLKECAWCGRQFAPTRFDQRFDCRECLDKWFHDERKQAVAALRERQKRAASFFRPGPQLLDDEEDEDNQVRRTG